MEIIEDRNTAWYHQLDINSSLMNFKLHSGVDLTLITVENFEKLVPKSKLESVRYQISSPGGRVPVIGKFVTHRTHKETPQQFNVTVANFKNK